MIEFKLPSLGADMDVGTLLEWQVRPGDTVKRGQVVAVVDTAKAAVEVECWQAGEVFELLLEPGAKVPVGTPLLTLLSAGESRATARRLAPSVAPVAQSTTQPPVMAAVMAPVVEVAMPVASRPRISPAARKRAAALGLDPAGLTGSGPHGVVTLEDVEAAGQRATPDRYGVVTLEDVEAAGQRATPDRHGVVTLEDVEAAGQRAAPDRHGVVTLEDVEAAVQRATPDRHGAMRQAIAAAMARSKREIPHYYLADSMPLGPAMAWLRARNAECLPEARLLPGVLLLKAVALALRDYPQLNGFWQDGVFAPATSSHLGVAIALRQGGLIAPALHDVADKPLAQLMGEFADLVQRARGGSLRSSELSDASLTVSQLGEQGVDSLFGVIYPPQVALVGFGRIAERPWVEAGQLCVQATVMASLAADHRVSDGHYGARFLTAVRRLLQTPEQL